MASQPPESDDEEGTTDRGPLRTREVFLDTQVYRSLGFDADKPSLEALKNHIREDRLALHITDITRGEIASQIHEQARQAMDKITAARATLLKWQKRSPLTLGNPALRKPIDVDAV